MACNNHWLISKTIMKYLRTRRNSATIRAQCRSTIKLLVTKWQATVIATSSNLEKKPYSVKELRKLCKKSKSKLSTAKTIENTTTKSGVPVLIFRPTVTIQKIRWTGWGLRRRSLSTLSTGFSPHPCGVLSMDGTLTKYVHNTEKRSSSCFYLVDFTYSFNFKNYFTVNSGF